MRSFLKKIALAVCFLCALGAFSACGDGNSEPKHYTLTETTYFAVLKNMLYFPEGYLDSTLDLDCFIYEVEDVETGVVYPCGVRKCPANFGCKCGNDSILGFLLRYDGEIPAARNQTTNDSDKTWIHLSGTLENAELTAITVYSYGADGNPTGKTEKIYFCSLQVDSLTEIDGSGLKYYVS